jgi:hypothetical protein
MQRRGRIRLLVQGQITMQVNTSTTGAFTYEGRLSLCDSELWSTHGKQEDCRKIAGLLIDASWYVRDGAAPLIPIARCPVKMCVG